MVFTDAERSFLAGQRLGRLATVAPDGAPQNNPVGFRYDAEAGTFEIGGHALGASRKFRNVLADGRVSLVVDELVSVQPWRVRGVEIRGRAEALTDQDPLMPHFSGERIRIHPERVIAWGIDPDVPGVHGRNVRRAGPDDQAPGRRADASR